MNQRIYHLAGIVSTRIANLAGHPVTQIAVLLVCFAWWWFGLSENALASTLTIGGFVLTQMVLNQQRRRENALHLKVDELLLAVSGARNEVTGAEHATEGEIERLREGRDSQAGEE